jgi:hypothetical protein
MPTHVITINGTVANADTGDAIVPVYQRKITLTDAQIKSLPGTILELVPAPGVGKIIVVDKVVMISNFSAAYIGADTLNGTLEISVGNSLSIASLPNVDAEVSQLQQLLGNTGQKLSITTGSPSVRYNSSWDATLSDVIGIELTGDYGAENQNVNIRVGGTIETDFTGGDPSNTLGITVFYSIVEL